MGFPLKEYYIRSLRGCGNSYHVTIPKNLLDELGWEHGDGIHFKKTKDNKLILKKI